MYSMEVTEAVDFKLENPTDEEQEKVNNMKEGVKLYITIGKLEIDTTIQTRKVMEEMGHAKLILRCDNGEISILHDGNVLIRGLVINNRAKYLDPVISLDNITVIPPEKGGGRKSKRRRYRSTKRKRSRRYK